MVLRKSSPLISSFAFLSLMACQSGGGGGDPIDPPNNNFPTPPPPAYDAPDTPSISANNIFNTEEFRENYGLQSMNSHSAYGAGATGEGIMVAIIDDGIDLGHPDLQQNISPLSRDIYTGEYNDVDVAANNPHGTQLAGIIAAAKNDIGIHGVAYNATILAIKALGEDYHNVHDIAAGIDYAIESGARVINLSITYPELPDTLRAALDRAVEADILVVISAGNNLPSSSARAHLDAISNYATLASANGQVMAVGSIDKANELSYFSNRPGEEAKDFYILAPGVDIITTTVGGGLYELSPDPDPQFFGIDLDASGTSFAAPHVAGAAALMFDLFPNLTAKEVVEILFSGATDVGASGVDAITGHGIINLGVSIQPMGATSIPMGQTSMALNIPMSQSLFLTSPAFGDALQVTNAFEGGFFQDKYRRAYQFDFRELMPTPDVGIHLADQMSGKRGLRNISANTGHNTTLHFTLKDINWWENEEGAESNISGDQFSGRKIKTSAFISTTQVTPSTQMKIRHGFNMEPITSFSFGQPELQPLNIGASLRGFADIAGHGTSMTVEQKTGLESALSFSMSTNNRKNSFTNETHSTNSMTIRFKGQISQKLQYGIEIGQLEEGTGFIGSQGFGAFGGMQGAKSSFGTIAASYKLGPISLFGLYSRGVTELSASNIGLIKDFSTLHSTAFQAGIFMENPLSDDGFFTFSVSQPLRVSQGQASVDIATGLNARDELTRNVRALSLAPKGRELDFSMAYKVNFKRFSLTSNLLHRKTPGHISNSSSDTSFLLQLSSRF